jgi:outer membrane biosynthesis protein TonB
MKRFLGLVLVAALGAGVTLAAMAYVHDQTTETTKRVTRKLEQRTEQLEKFIREKGLEVPPARERPTGGPAPVIADEPSSDPQPKPKPDPPGKPPKPKPDPKPEPPTEPPCTVKVLDVCVNA